MTTASKSTQSPSERGRLLVSQLDLIWSLFEHYLVDLDDDALFWEPAPGAWNVRQDAQGKWVTDWQVPEPDPAPTTSIAWIAWHIGFWWTATHRHCFASVEVERQEIVWPGRAEEVVAWLRGLRDEWRAELVQLTDEELDSPDQVYGLTWAEGLKLVDVAAWVNFELAKNVSEIGVTARLRRAVG